jgi:hypothetical protein
LVKLYLPDWFTNPGAWLPQFHLEPAFLLIASSIAFFSSISVCYDSSAILNNNFWNTEGILPASKNKFIAAGSYDFEIADANGAGKIGELRLKPSSILWKPKSQRKYLSISLEEFVDWIKQNGKTVDR